MALPEDTEPVELEWNGHDIPEGLARLPPGRYRIEPAQEWDLTEEEEAGLEEAFQSLERGEGIPFEKVAEELRQRFAGRRRS